MLLFTVWWPFSHNSIFAEYLIWSLFNSIRYSHIRFNQSVSANISYIVIRLSIPFAIIPYFLFFLSVLNNIRHLRLRGCFVYVRLLTGFLVYYIRSVLLKQLLQAPFCRMTHTISLPDFAWPLPDLRLTFTWPLPDVHQTFTRPLPDFYPIFMNPSWILIPGLQYT